MTEVIVIVAGFFLIVMIAVFVTYWNVPIINEYDYYEYDYDEDENDKF